MTTVFEPNGLTGRATLPADGDAGAKAAGSGRGFAPPPAPPPPPEMSRKQLIEARREANRQLRSTTTRDVALRLRRVHRSWWWLLAGVVFALASVWFLKFLTTSLVDAATVGRAPASSATTIVQQVGIPNPLDDVKLTKQAAIFLGAHDTDGDGMVDTLDDQKSARAIAEILKATDLCGWYVSINATFQPVLSRQSSGGSVQLADCPAPVSTTTVVPSTATAAPK